MHDDLTVLLICTNDVCKIHSGHEVRLQDPHTLDINLIDYKFLRSVGNNCILKTVVEQI